MIESCGSRQSAESGRYISALALGRLSRKIAPEYLLSGPGNWVLSFDVYPEGWKEGWHNERNIRVTSAIQRAFEKIA